MAEQESVATEQESANLEAAEETPSVATLAKLSDDELMDLLGLKRTLKSAKDNIAKMQALTGDALKYANERIESMFTPSVYPGDFSYIIENAQRKAKCQTGDQARCDCSPCSVLD